MSTPNPSSGTRGFARAPGVVSMQPLNGADPLGLIGVMFEGTAAIGGGRLLGRYIQSEGTGPGKGDLMIMLWFVLGGDRSKFSAPFPDPASHAREDTPWQPLDVVDRGVGGAKVLAFTKVGTPADAAGGVFWCIDFKETLRYSVVILTIPRELWNPESSIITTKNSGTGKTLTWPSLTTRDDRAIASTEGLNLKGLSWHLVAMCGDGIDQDRTQGKVWPSMYPSPPGEGWLYAGTSAGATNEGFAYALGHSRYAPSNGSTLPAESISVSGSGARGWVALRLNVSPPPYIFYPFDYTVATGSVLDEFEDTSAFNERFTLNGQIKPYIGG